MGLGTKIKEALTGDKAHHDAQRRKTPGAYPESVDIPRTTTDTWKSTQTNPKKSSPVTKDGNISENEEYDEYTHMPVNSGHNEEEFIPSPDSRISNEKTGKLSKGSSQSPYWGNVGKPHDSDIKANRADMGNFPDRDRANFSSNHPAEWDGLGRTTSVSRTQHPTFGGDEAGERRKSNHYEAPIGSVNRRQPQLVHDEAARASSMAASQVSHPTDIDGGHESSGLGYGRPAYGANHAMAVNQYDDNSGVQRTPTVNGKRTVAGVGGNFESAYQGDGDRELNSHLGKPDHDQSWPKTVNEPGNTLYTNPAYDPHSQNFPGTEFVGHQLHSNKIPESTNRERERTSPVSGSENGSGVAARSSREEHYGPGHSGAKVLHRCQHCGNDNDITRYFSKDVVYRLS